ncbi:hypothetical protein ACFFWD_39820 [Bradyrhizobium erythrophlei]|uniref:hypothetical protein n=1 Tax=Bradyrhizobium erythrophlei TaxID=1437360 RepID=UPI0035EC6008
MIRRRHRLGAAAVALLSLLAAQLTRGTAASRDVTGDDTSLLYLSPADWEQQPPPRKVALAADFMRIFCTDQTMSPATLADCLDKDKANGALFERAIACASGR